MLMFFYIWLDFLNQLIALICFFLAFWKDSKMSAKELISIKGILKLFPCCKVNNNQIVFCSESNIVELNWGYVVVARANWKSGESASIKKQEMWQCVCQVRHSCTVCTAAPSVAVVGTTKTAGAKFETSHGALQSHWDQCRHTTARSLFVCVFK